MQLDDLKILICDDSILARKQMKDIINSIGSPTIIEAANGQLAIDMYKEHKPNLTFIDIVMPLSQKLWSMTAVLPSSLHHLSAHSPSLKRLLPPEHVTSFRNQSTRIRS